MLPQNNGRSPQSGRHRPSRATPWTPPAATGPHGSVLRSRAASRRPPGRRGRPGGRRLPKRVDGTRPAIPCQVGRPCGRHVVQVRPPRRSCSRQKPRRVARFPPPRLSWLSVGNAQPRGGCRRPIRWRPLYPGGVPRCRHAACVAVTRPGRRTASAHSVHDSSVPAGDPHRATRCARRLVGQEMAANASLSSRGVLMSLWMT